MTKRRHRPAGRPPKTDDTERICDNDDCDVKLSRYNTGTSCWSHTPKTKPRLRGRP